MTMPTKMMTRPTETFKSYLTLHFFLNSALSLNWLANKFINCVNQSKLTSNILSQFFTDLCFSTILSLSTWQFGYSPKSLFTHVCLICSIQKSDLYILPSLQLTYGCPLLATSSTSLSSTSLHWHHCTDIIVMWAEIFLQLWLDSNSSIHPLIAYSFW